MPMTFIGPRVDALTHVHEVTCQKNGRFRYGGDPKQTRANAAAQSTIDAAPASHLVFRCAKRAGLEFPGVGRGR
jgi:hypothetical protein